VLGIELKLDFLGRFAESIIAIPQIISIKLAGIYAYEFGESLILMIDVGLYLLYFRVVRFKVEYLLENMVDLY
jgi:hypothetical protein